MVVNGGIKPIETLYNGYRFRSRLEARWAVFFDALECKWDYELEGYELDGVRYLPDFRLWEPYSCWIEIKPNADCAKITDAMARCSRLCLATGTRSVLVTGSPWPGEYKLVLFVPQANGQPVHMGNSGFEWLFRARSYDWDHAYLAARGARFEHGEHP